MLGKFSELTVTGAGKALSCFCIEYRSAATVTRITLYIHAQYVLKGISTNSGGQRPEMIPQYDLVSRS